MNVVQQCRTACKRTPQRIVFADALDERVLVAANELQKYGLARPILVGSPFELRDYAYRHELEMSCFSVIDPKIPGVIDNFVDEYQKYTDSKTDRDRVRKSLESPLYYAAMMVHMGQADVCIAGNLSTTSDVLRAALRVIGVADKQETVSSFFLMSSSLDDKVMLFADAGVVPEPTVQQLSDITIDAARSFEKLTGQTARVAMLSFSTKGSSDHPAAMRVREAFEQVRIKSPSLIVDGELQFDAATVPAVAAHKAPNSPLQGNSNVLVFPSLNAGKLDKVRPSNSSMAGDLRTTHTGNYFITHTHGC